MTSKSVTTFILLIVGVGVSAGAYVKYKTDAEGCDVSPSDRADCAWKGIDSTDCESVGCCFNNYKFRKIWCFCKEVNLLTSQPVTCTASSVFWAGTVSCQYTYDGTALDGPYHEWMSDGESDGAWVEYTFTKPMLINRINVWQLCLHEFQYRTLVLTFSDGTSHTVTLAHACDGSSGACLDPGDGSPQNTAAIPPVVTTSVRVEGQDDCAPSGFNGLREVQLIGWVHRVTCHDAACEDPRWYCDADLQCDDVNCGGCIS